MDILRCNDLVNLTIRINGSLKLVLLAVIFLTDGYKNLMCVYKKPKPTALVRLYHQKIFKGLAGHPVFYYLQWIK
jgi:hypothetical protein